MGARQTKPPTKTLRCRQCGNDFPVYREAKNVARFLSNLGYVCLSGTDDRRHHLVFWDVPTEDAAYERAVICGGCGEATPMPDAEPPRESNGVRIYAPPNSFGCPQHRV